MPDENSLSTKARHTPWNKVSGSSQTSGAPKPSLVDPNPTPDRKTDPRPCPFQPCDRQQVAWLRRRRLEGRRCRSEWLCGRSCDRPTEEAGRPVKFELTDQTRQAVDDFLKEAGKRPGEYLFTGHRGRDRAMTTRQYARLLTDWVASIGLDPGVFGTHSLRRTKATLIHRRTGNLRAVQLLLGHTKIESTVRYLGIEVDDALAIAEQVDV